MKNRIHYAASEHDPDMLYATRFFAPDPFLWFQKGRRTTVILSDLEVDRGKATAQCDAVLSLSEECKRHGCTAGQTAKWIAAALKSRKIIEAEVPPHFPLGLAQELGRLGIKLTPAKGSFFPEREIKSPDEIALITAAQRVAEIGITRVREILSASSIAKNRTLTWCGSTLTSERLQGEINAAIALSGGCASGTIVAGGEQACDPHERGSGTLRASEAIIVDVFPRMNKTGYWGDITRSFIKGTPSTALAHLYHTVLAEQRRALKELKAGVDGSLYEKELRARFESAGYPTGEKDGRRVGFFHGLGHGVGLEIHEKPRISAGKLKDGQVISVEPGLYCPGLGGVRVEDLVAVEKGRIRNLTKLPKDWVL